MAFVTKKTSKWQDPPKSNLQSFLTSTTPSVQKHPISKAHSRGQALESDIDFFHLGNVWNEYAEWSAFGAGVPICLENGTSVVQYYVPYLSALQIYTTNSPAASSAFCSKTPGFSSKRDSLCGCSTVDHVGYLYYEFSERCSPYVRLPLANKVWELAREYPGLATLRSDELSPASWMSVAWYPIYQIPAQINAQELSVCFLTFHSLSSSFPGTSLGNKNDNPGESSGHANPRARNRGKGPKPPQNNRFPLQPFGLAALKMKGGLWTRGEHGTEKMSALFSAADSWLKQKNFQHHDFEFFRMNSM